MAKTMQRLALVLTLATPAMLLAAEPAAESPPSKSTSAPTSAQTSAQSAGPAVNTSAPTRPAAATAAPGQKAPQRAGNDRLDLSTTVVTGNRELPKVLYIVPWKKADIGDLPAQPFNTLLDEVLTPVDRDVFRREVTYYGAVSSAGNAAAPASPAPANGPPNGTEK